MTETVKEQEELFKEQIGATAPEPVPEQVDHWLKIPKQCNRFWARASDLGHDKNTVHEYFGVQTMYDYSGTFSEAYASLDGISGWLESQEAATESGEPEPEPVEEQVPDFPPEDETFEPELPAKAAGENLALLQACGSLPEAPALAWTKYIDRAGFTWSITIRAGLPDDQATEALRSLMRQVNLFKKAAEANDWIPAGFNGNGGYNAPAPALPPKMQKSERGTPPPPPAASAAPQKVEAGDDGDHPKGIKRLHTIKVDADGRVEFYLDGFQWPLKDGRGAEVVAGLFDPDLGWTPEHFVPGAKYDGLDLTAQWEKPGKYRDVVRVY